MRKATLGSRTRQRCFVTRKQGVEESRRFETSVAVIFVTIESETVIKYLLLIVPPKAFFKVLAGAMALSHYAAEFFRDQRNRVTLGTQRVCEFAFSKAAAAINVVTGLLRFLSENILPAAKRHQIKIRMHESCLTPPDVGQH
jgi:hypothetical protein